MPPFSGVKPACRRARWTRQLVRAGNCLAATPLAVARYDRQKQQRRSLSSALPKTRHREALQIAKPEMLLGKPQNAILSEREQDDAHVSLAQRLCQIDVASRRSND